MSVTSLRQCLAQIRQQGSSRQRGYDNANDNSSFLAIFNKTKIGVADKAHKVFLDVFNVDAAAKVAVHYLRFAYLRCVVILFRHHVISPVLVRLSA